MECSESGAPTGDYPVLRNAPITEALIDIRVAGVTGSVVEGLASFRDAFPSRFPEKRSRSSVATTINFDQKAPPTLTAKGPNTDGYIFTSPAENLVAQVRTDGFTLSKLKPYDSWKTFCPQFVALWRRYLEVAQPAKITRVALRYVNRIVVPTGKDLKGFILTGPEIAPKLPQDLPAFLMRLVLPSQNGEIAIVTETFEPSLDLHSVPLIFDIDVFREIELGLEDPALWQTIKGLRSYKNQIFFNSITPTALEVFK
jgi:uncharacterized protein (TIGR04255 family)